MAETAQRIDLPADGSTAATTEMALCSERYCIIGAGPAGLGVARRFAEAGIAFDVLERHKDVGGIWDLENPGTPMYESAHFISSKALSGYTDFAFPEGTPDYPSRAQVLAFIRSYADHHGLRKYVEQGVEVLNMEKHAAGWLLQLRGQPPRIYRGVVLANGHQWVPNLPEYPGASLFRGQLLHAVDYRSPALFEGKRVLIVGCGATAIDIANDAATRAQRVVLSARRGHYFVPKHMFGRPTDVWASDGPALPAPLRQALLSRLLKWLHGDLSRYGMPEPDYKILERPPILNSMIFEHLSHGRIQAKPDVRRIDENGVQFKDDSFERFDVIVYCTGYHECWPFLPAHYLRATGENDLYLQVFHRRFDDLFVAGMLRSNAGGFAVFEQQAEAIARAILVPPALRERWRSVKQSGQASLGSGIRYQKNAYQSPYFDARAYAGALAKCARQLEE